jgi:hypothetical protein
MIKTISLEWLQSKGACKESLEAWQKETDHSTFTTLSRLMAKNHEWGNWLICRIMNKNRSVQYAIFAAEQVIDIYEGKYPNDKRPRNAIEAAKAYLKNQSKKTKAYAYTAAKAADDAACTTYTAAEESDAVAAAYAAAYAAASVAYAAASVAYAAYTAAPGHAAYAAYAYAADAADAAYKRRKIKAKILKYGIGLLKQ